MLYILPLIGGITGWIFNSLLIRLLFRPVQRKNILGLDLQGIFPAMQPKLALQLSREVATKYISFDKISAKLHDPQLVKKAMPFIEEKIDGFIKVKLKEEMPLLSMFIKDDSLNGIKKGMVQEIEHMFPELINKLTEGMKEDLDIEKLVREKITAIDSTMLERLMYTELKKEIRLVKGMGALGGFLIACIMVLLMKLPVS